MGNNTQTFEVKVLVRKKGSKHFSSHIGMYIEKSITKMYHIEARTHVQAFSRAKKYGRPISTRKIDIEKVSGVSMENLLLREPYGKKNPYPDAMAMDEFIWRKKTKRAERIEDRGKDKE